MLRAVTVAILASSLADGLTTVLASNTNDNHRQSPTPNKIGSMCYSNNDCGQNEECVRLAVRPACRVGTCQCKSCFGSSTLSQQAPRCVPLQVKRLCNDTRNSYQLYCDNTCTGSPLERYPENAFCQKTDNQLYGQVKCVDYKCFRETRDGQCERIPPGKRRGETCSADCQCGSNLRCVAKCRCGDGLRWDGRSCSKPVYNDPCSSDLDCNSFGLVTIGGSTYQGGVCDRRTQRCTCDSLRGFVATNISYYDDANGSLRSKTVCVVADAMQVVGKSQTCSMNPDQQLTNQNRDKPSAALVCNSTASLFCYACPETTLTTTTTAKSTLDNDESRDEPTLGVCSQLRGEFKSPEKCLMVPAGSFPLSTLFTEVSRLGQLCTTNGQCGSNEMCDLPPVEPACRYGRCACRRCYGANERNVCSPMRLLELGERCSGTDNELYPSGSWCGPSSTVICDLNHLRQDNECVRPVYTSSYDSLCGSDSDCDEGLQCLSGDHRVCDCGADNQRWSPDDDRCILRRLGDPCAKHEECADIVLEANDVNEPAHNRPVCSRLLKVCTLRLELSPVSRDPSKCLHCPEDPQTAPCRRDIFSDTEWPSPACL